MARANVKEETDVRAKNNIMVLLEVSRSHIRREKKPKKKRKEKAEAFTNAEGLND